MYAKPYSNSVEMPWYITAVIVIGGVLLMTGTVAAKAEPPFFGPGSLNDGCSSI